MKIKYFLILFFLLFILLIPGITTASANSLTISKTQAGNVVTILSDILVTDTPRNTVSNLKLYNHTTLLDSFTYGTNQTIPSNILTRLTHEFGQTVNSISHFIVNATVNHITYTTFTNNYQTSSGTGWNGSLWVEKFTGLTPGATIKTLALNVTQAVGNVRVKVYQDNANATSNNSTHNYETLQAGNWNGGVYVEKFTGLPVGQNITGLSLNVTQPIGNVRVKVYQDNGGNVSSTQTNVHETVSTTGWQGLVWTQKFTGLPPGGIIDTFGLQAAIANGNIRFKIYQDNGVNGGPSTLLGESGSVAFTCAGTNCGYSVTATIPASGNVWAGFELDSATVNLLYQNGLASGTAKTVAHAYGTGPSPFGTITNQTIAPWAKISYHYVIPGYPGTLLGESGSIALGIAGHIQFTVTATIPASGNVWAGFETSVNTVNLGYSTGLTTGTSIKLPDGDHTYGSGPNPFGIGTNQTLAHWMRLHYSPTIHSGDPGTLLTQTSSLPVSYNGVYDFPVNVNVPASGNVWAGFEASSNSLGLKYSTGLASGSSKTISHTYGTGPNPFGTGTNQTVAPWSQLTFNPITTTSIFTSNNLTVNSAFMPSYSFNCGIHCSPKLVNYTVTRADNYSKLYLTVNVLPVPFDIECKVINGTFIQSFVWSNHTQVNLFNESFNVPYNENVSGACFGSGQLLSFLSHGNQTALQTSVSVFDASIGQMVGVPTGVFFIVLAGMLANSRTGPIWVVILLAMIGIMGIVPFFNLSPGIWALAVITGMLGLLVGRKIF